MTNPLNQHEVVALTDSNLLTHYTNARYTGMTCGGHSKGNWNEVYAKKYLAEITKRGLDVDNSLDGEFNGPGAY